MYLVIRCKVVCVVWRETRLSGVGYCECTQGFCYMAQAGRDVKIQSSLDFMVVVCILIIVISVIIFVADLAWHSLLFYHRLEKHAACFDLKLKKQ